MKGMRAALWAEILKARRSTMLWATILAFLFIPMMMGVLMFVIKNPEMAQKFGMIGTKAAMLRFGKVDWSAYLGLLTQAMVAIGLLGFGFVTSWVFGREYSDRTIPDLLALPVLRFSIVLSKFIVVLSWCTLLSIIFFWFGLVIGGVLHLSGWSDEIIFLGAHRFAMTSLLTILLCTPVAFFASYGRGYLPPMGFIILTLIIAQFIGVVGLGPYFPWAIPGLYIGGGETEGIQLGVASYLILCFTSIAGFLATFAWWRFADQT